MKLLLIMTCEHNLPPHISLSLQTIHVLLVHTEKKRKRNRVLYKMGIIIMVALVYYA